MDTTRARQFMENLMNIIEAIDLCGRQVLIVLLLRICSKYTYVFNFF